MPKSHSTSTPANGSPDRRSVSAYTNGEYSKPARAQVVAPRLGHAEDQLEARIDLPGGVGGHGRQPDQVFLPDPQGVRPVRPGRDSHRDTFPRYRLSVGASIAIGYPVAYYIARHARRTKTLLLVLLVLPLWISYLMRMLA